MSSAMASRHAAARLAPCLACTSAHANHPAILVSSSLCSATRTAMAGLPSNQTRNLSFWPTSRRNDSAQSVVTSADSSKGSSAPDSAKDPSANRLPHQMDKFEPGWAMTHARYTQEELDSVKIVHRELSGFGDRVAAAMVAVMRWGFDVATRYPKHREKFPRVAGSDSSVVKLNEQGKTLQRKQNAAAATDEGSEKNKPAATPSSALSVSKPDDLPEEMTLGEMRRRGLSFGPEQWLIRIVFLESVAGVPGMMAAMARHLHSLRLLRRDKGWIHTLLEDAANERQHLLVSLKLYEPGLFMRGLLIGTQGVFCNFFFLLYLVAPRVAHRFVGLLEEEAVVTYTRILEDIHAGRLPEWENVKAPAIAIDYWGLPKDATLVDVVRALRADEASHRYINHTFAEIEQTDYNPFAYREASPATRGLTWGMTRDEAQAHFAREDAEARALFDAQKKQPRDNEAGHDIGKPTEDADARAPRL